MCSSSHVARIYEGFRVVDYAGTEQLCHLAVITYADT